MNTKFVFLSIAEVFADSSISNVRTQISNESSNSSSITLSSDSHRHFGNNFYMLKSYNMDIENTGIVKFIKNVKNAISEINIFPNFEQYELDKNSNSVEESSEGFDNNMNKSNISEHIIINEFKKEDTNMLIQDFVNALHETWSHIDEDSIKELINLRYENLDDIHELFVNKSERRLEIAEKNVILGQMIPELFIYEIENSALLFMANATYQREDEKLIKIVTPPEDISYALIIKNYDDSKKKEFEKYIEEKFWDEIYNDMKELEEL